MLAAFSRCGAAEPVSGEPNSPRSATDTSSLAEFARIEAQDDAAQAEVDKWIHENQDLKAKGQGVSDEVLERRIQQRFDPVRQAYDKFVQTHPNIARARVGYGNFLNDRQDE